MSAAEKHDEPEPYIRWSTFDVIQNQAQFLREEDPELSEDEAFGKAAEDPFVFEFEWDYLQDSLREKLQEYNPDNKPWHVEVRGFGWRNLDGEKDLRTNDPKEFLNGILPDTDCTFDIFMFDDRKRMSIHNFHHDSPMGEWYYIEVAHGKKDEEDEED